MHKMNHPSMKCQPWVLHLNNPFFLSRRWINKFGSFKMPLHFQNEPQINPQFFPFLCTSWRVCSTSGPWDFWGMCWKEPIYIHNVSGDAKIFSSNFWPQQTYTVTKCLVCRKKCHGIAIAYLVKLDCSSHELKCVFFTGRKLCFIYNKFWETR